MGGNTFPSFLEANQMPDKCWTFARNVNFLDLLQPKDFLIHATYKCGTHPLQFVRRRRKFFFLFFQKTKFVCQTLFNMDCLGLKMIFFAIVLGCCCWHFFIGFSLLLLHIQCISIHVKSQTLIAYSFPILSIACFLVITIRYHIQMFRCLNSIHMGIQKHIVFLFPS